MDATTTAAVFILSDSIPTKDRHGIQHWDPTLALVGSRALARKLSAIASAMFSCAW